MKPVGFRALQGLTIWLTCRKPEHPRNHPQAVRRFSSPYLLVVVLSFLSVNCASTVRPLPQDGIILDEHDASDDASTSSGESAIEPSVVPEEEKPDIMYEARSGMQVHGYYAWWTRGLWLDLDLGLYDKLFFFDITPASDGSLQARNGYPFAWEGLIQRADSFNVPVIPTLALLDADSLQTLFLNPDNRQRLLDTSLGLIEESGGAGLHLDFEWFAPAEDSLRDGFHSYVDTLAAAVAKRFPKAELSMFVPAFHSEGMIDLSRIPAQFQEIMVQGYDFHWQTGPQAGPLSPLKGWSGQNWQAILTAMDERGIKRDRLFFTVPYYGYEWPVESDAMGARSRGEARVTTHAQLDTLNLPELQLASQSRIREYGMIRDSLSGSPYYQFEDSTGWNQGWYEDAVSLGDKYGFVAREGLAGIAIFPIGYDDGIMDPLLAKRFGTRIKGDQATR